MNVELNNEEKEQLVERFEVSGSALTIVRIEDKHHVALGYNVLTEGMTYDEAKSYIDDFKKIEKIAINLLGLMIDIKVKEREVNNG